MIRVVTFPASVLLLIITIRQRAYDVVKIDQAETQAFYGLEPICIFYTGLIIVPGPIGLLGNGPLMSGSRPWYSIASRSPL